MPESDTGADVRTTSHQGCVHRRRHQVDPVHDGLDRELFESITLGSFSACGNVEPGLVSFGLGSYDRKFYFYCDICKLHDDITSGYWLLVTSRCRRDLTLQPCTDNLEFLPQQSGFQLRLYQVLCRRVRVESGDSRPTTRHDNGNKEHVLTMADLNGLLGTVG